MKFFFFCFQEIREEIRQRVREVELTGRQLNLVLSKIHQVFLDTIVFTPYALLI